MKKIYIILSGGGAIQLESAAGILQALDESGVLADTDVEYLACSGGSPVAALHASGLPGAGICELIRATPMSSLVYRPVNSRYFDVSGVVHMLKKYMPATPLRNCRVAVTREHDGKVRYPLATPITATASMSIQGAIQPQIIDGEAYGDGGVRDLTPTPSIRQMLDAEHVYFALPPRFDDEPEKPGLEFEESFFYRMLPRQIQHIYKQIREIPYLLDRLIEMRQGETHQLDQLNLDELENVTIFRPTVPETARGRGLLAELLEWSPRNVMIQAAYEYAKEKLKGARIESEID